MWIACGSTPGTLWRYEVPLRRNTGRGQFPKKSQFSVFVGNGFVCNNWWYFSWRCGKARGIPIGSGLGAGFATLSRWVVFRMLLMESEGDGGSNIKHGKVSSLVLYPTRASY